MFFLSEYEPDNRNDYRHNSKETERPEDKMGAFHFLRPL